LRWGTSGLNLRSLSRRNSGRGTPVSSARVSRWASVLPRQYRVLQLQLACRRETTNQLPSTTHQIVDLAALVSHTCSARVAALEPARRLMQRETQTPHQSGRSAVGAPEPGNAVWAPISSASYRHFRDPSENAHRLSSTAARTGAITASYQRADVERSLCVSAVSLFLLAIASPVVLAAPGVAPFRSLQMALSVEL
jgi:hypothetical protein